MTSLLPSVFVLGLAALAALHLATSRRSPPERVPERRAAARTLALSIVVQGIHFVEEAATGLPERLGALFGLAAMPVWFFVAFNLAWIGIWIASVAGVRSGRGWAFFAAWFLVVAGIFNGVLHPLMAVRAGGYFPGLVTAPLVAAVALWLGARLRKATTSGPRP